MKKHRIEKDSMGEMKIPEEAYYGAETARAIKNFPVSNLRFSREFIRALGLIKKHAAMTNGKLGLLPKKFSEAIKRASQEVVDGKFDGDFVVDIFQTGSGTSTNMNVNEVIANRAAEILGSERGGKLVHPNDHVNLGQSSNDVIPSAIHIAALEGIRFRLIPSLSELKLALDKKAYDFRKIIKVGRTHLQDATPIRLGQEFGSYASQIKNSIEQLERTEEVSGKLALGGTAVGTGINTHPRFAALTIAGISKETKLKLKETENHFAAQGAIDALVQTSGALKATAVNLIKIANDIRLLGSGPRCGFGELILSATQPGSSIMPGKVNPVMCEMVIQVGTQVIGNDTVVTLSGITGQLELNTMLPVTAYNILQSIELLSKVSLIFSKRCVKGIKANTKKCAENLEKNLSMATALTPVTGYDKAAEIAINAFKTNKTVREVAAKSLKLKPSELKSLLDPEKMTGHVEKKAENKKSKSGF